MRSFIYLDQYKLYSFSSQLFRGLVDHVVRVTERTRNHGEREGGNLAGSARVVADIASENFSTAEKTFLHDHAYDLFEDELKARGALLDVGTQSRLEDFQTSRFIRVTGPAIFADATVLRGTIANFNKLMEALAYVTKSGDVAKARAAAAEVLASSKDRNAQERAKQSLKVLSPQAVAQASGMRQDPQFLESLVFLLQYGFGEQLHVQLPVECEGGALQFSAVLRREALRETETILLHKYARVTDRSLVVVGVPTQAGGPTAKRLVDSEGGLREAIAGLMGHMSGIEDTFAGRMAKEVIVDPIAVYVDWPVAPTGVDVDDKSPIAAAE
jgi:hypothetical protein